MSNLVDINDILNKFKNVKEVHEYTKVLFSKLESMTSHCQSLKQEVEHLKTQLVNSKLPSIGLQISNEQLICEMELARLKDLASQRSLSLEETKKFEIFSKQLINIKKEIPLKDEDETPINIKLLKEEDLIKLAEDK